MIPNIRSPYAIEEDSYLDIDEPECELTELPLNILSLVISHLHDPRDLSRACLACRRLYYMCLPNLYSHVKLKSYDHVRYSHDSARPEGCGAGSPFAMGLNALITRPVAQYVRSFEVAGTYKEIGAEEYSKVGRIPDGGMMLNISIRAALDRMVALESFAWNLNIKMLWFNWDALVEKNSLKALTIRCPSERIPAPIHTAPGMPNLKSLTITDMDPLCYPDNFQALLHESLSIEHLKMHWSPRMRRERETSVNLNMYFGRLSASNKKLRVKTLALQNLYSLGHEGNLLGAYEAEALETMTMIDSTGGADDDGNMAFVTEPPKRLAPMPNLRVLRGNKVSSSHCARLTKMRPLKEYYLISGRDLRGIDTPSSSRAGSVASPGSQLGASHHGSVYNGRRSVGGTPQSIPDSKSSPGSMSNPFAAPSTAGTVASSSDAAVAVLGQYYLDNITRYHGRSLTRLLLQPQWKLSKESLKQLTSSCIVLQQLGVGLQNTSFETLQLIVPNMPHLWALRILEASTDWDQQADGVADSTEWYEGKISEQTLRSGWDELKWLGLGSMVFELLSPEKTDRYDGEEAGYSESSEDEMDDDSNRRRLVAHRPLMAVKDVDIWKMDRKQIVF